MKMELMMYLINEYIEFIGSDYCLKPLKFSEWLYEAEKCDYYKKDIFKLKDVIENGN